MKNDDRRLIEDYLPIHVISSTKIPSLCGGYR